MFSHTYNKEKAFNKLASFLKPGGYLIFGDPNKIGGFQNMLQDLWFGSKAPKYYKWTNEHKARNDSYDNQHGFWTRREWLWIFMFHRITGSGASFEEDHGYRNTVVPQLAKLKTCEEMASE